MAVENQVTDKDLAQALIEQGLTTQEAIDQLLDQQHKGLEQAQKEMGGISFQVNISNSLLLVKESFNSVNLSELDIISEPEEFDKDDWDNWAQHICFINSEDGSFLSSIPLSLVNNYGLILNEDISYVYTPEITQAPYLGQSNQILYNSVFKGSPYSHPLDLYLSPDHKLLAVSDRGAGNITLITTDLYQKLATINLRNPGSTKALNIVFDLSQNRILATDNATSNLFAIDLDTFDITKHKVGLGILGNLCMAPTQEHFYLLTLKPNISLKYIHSQTLKAEKDLKLKGDLFSIDSNSPCDLLSLSPDGQQLLIMTYLNEPEPFTPVVSVIDTNKVKTVKRYAIKDGIKPGLLSFAAPNPALEFNKEFSELVLEAGLVNPEDFWHIKRQLQAGALAEQDDEKKYLKVKKQIMDLDTPQKDLSESVQEDQTQEANSDIEAGAEAPEVEFGPEATREIMDMLMGAFYKQTRIFLTQYPDEISRFQIESEKITTTLSTHNSVSVKISGILQEHTLRTTISRKALMSILESRDEIKQAGASTSPTNCPNCSQPLLGRWECDACGLELESPERKLKRSIASVDACSHLVAGNIAIPNPSESKILQLDKDKYIVWELDVKLLSCYRPWDVLWLPEKHILIVDNELNKVVEYGADGSLIWELDASFSDKHKLAQPVKATRYDHPDGSVRYLIVDQGNHRVLEVDQEQKIHWEYGGDGSLLRHPSDIQYTHNQTYLIADTGNNRVIEIENDKVVWMYDDDEELSKPVAIQRLFDEHTIIVDAGNQRVIELGEDREICWKFAYGKTKLPGKFKIEQPIKMIRRETRNIILMDEFRMIEIMPSTSKIVWHMLIQHLKPKPNHKNPAPMTFSRDRNRQMYGMAAGQRFSKTAMLKKVPIFYEAEEAFFKDIAAALKPAMYQKGQFIVTKGEMGNEMFFVNRGQVAVLKDNQKTVVVTISEGDCFGEMALVLSSPRSASIRAQTYCELYKLNRDSFENIISSYPEFKKKIQRIAEERQQLSSLRKAEKSKQATDKLRKLMKSRKDPSKLKKAGSKAFKARDAQLENINFYCLDTSNNLVVKLDREGKGVWHYGSEESETLVQSQSIRELPQSLLIADTGNNRVIELATVGKQIIKEFGGENLQLSRPRSATRTHFGRTLIADQGNKRLIDVDSEGHIVWEFSTQDEIISPFYVEELESGNLLFVDTRLHMVKEITREGELIWCYGTERLFGKEDYQLFSPEFATRLPDGIHTLVADTGNNRIIELDSDEEIIWEFNGNEKYRLTRPSFCQRLGNGNTIIYHNNNRQIIEVDPKGKILWGFKMSLSGMLSEVRPDLQLSTKAPKADTLYTLDAEEKERIEQAQLENKNVFELTFKIAKECQLKSVRASLIMMIVEKIGEIVKTYPTPAKMLENKIDDSVIVILISDQSKEQLHEDTSDIPEVDQVIISDVSND